MRIHVASCAAALLLAGCASSGPAPVTIPQTKREPLVETLHGVAVADPYRWLEDVHAPDVQQWMSAQNSAARAHLAAASARDALRKRLTELTYVDTISVPERFGSRFFYSRKGSRQEKAVHCWRDGEHGAEHVLLDPNTMSRDGSLSVGLVAPSWDGRRAAYSIKERGEDAATLHVIDVDTGRTSDVDVIPGAKYADPQWLPDGSGFYYASLPVDPKIPIDELPGYTEIRFHKLGTPASADTLVHEKTGDPTRFLGVALSRDGHWLFVNVSRGWTATDLYFKDARDAAAPFRPLVTGVDALFSVLSWNDVFYVDTNDGAPNGRVFRCDPAKPDRASWTELIPERKDAALQSLAIVGGRLSALYLRDVHSELCTFGLDGRDGRDIALPGIGVASNLVGREDDGVAFYSFSSITEPPQILRVSVADGASTVWERIKYPIDPSQFTVEQVWYTSKDGTRVPMFLVHRKDLKRDGSNPTLLTGYGGFNVSMEPGFSALRYAWLERGGVYAVPNLRGGGEFGENWHRAGMRDRKQNVFDDFIAAAEWLIAEKITSPAKLAISGGSNGGLLVGAAMVQRPDLYRAVICAVPLLDMVRYHKFGSGRTWIDEYGSADDAEQFKTLYAYSPYHHVKDGVRYPALLMLSADSDDRVDPMHARKFVAAVQHANPGGTAFLRVEKNAGHGGADLRRAAVEEFADTYAFLVEQLGS